jgi:hypothetical protein
VTVRTRSARFARWALLRLEDRVTPTLNVWTGLAVDGLWSTDNNWSEFHVPTAADDAIINSNVTVTHNAGADAVHSLALSTGATLNLTGGSITDATTLDAPTGDSHFNLAGGALVGATVSNGSTVFATTSSGGTLSGVTLAGTLDMTTVYGASATVAGGLTLNGGTVLIGSNTGNYGLLSFDGGAQTLGGTGAVVFGTHVYDFLRAGPTSGSSLTIGPGVTVRGHTGAVGYSIYWLGPTDVTFTNQGTIQADTTGGTISLGGNNWTNTGTVEATGGGSLNLTAPANGWASTTPVTIDGGGSLTLGGTGWTTPGITLTDSTLNLGGTFTRADLGTLTRTGGTVNITGTLDNNTLALDATTGPWQLSGGTLAGGTVTTAGTDTLVGTPTGGTLSGVTLAGTFDLGAYYGSNATVVGGLTLNGGTVRIGNDSGNYGLLKFDGGSQTLGGSGAVVFGTHVYDFLQAGPSSGSSLTIGPNVVVHGATGSVGYSIYWSGATDVSVTLQGTVDADTAGGSISVMNAVNYAAGTLAGGTWEATQGNLRLLTGNGTSTVTSITTDAANVILDGPNSRFFGDIASTDALAGLQTIAADGSLTINGRPVTATGNFTNAGTLTVGPGGTFGVTHQYASSVIDFSSQYTTTSWSATQALGPPNTPNYGDYSTAWAPLLPNTGAEYLTLGFATPDFADGVIVRETNGNGFVSRVDAIDTNDVSHTVWTGTDLSQPETPVDFFASWPRTAYRVKAVKVYVDSSHSPTWEEIDSVQLVGPLTGFTQAAGETTVSAGGTLTVVPGAAVDIQGGLLEGTGTVAADVTNSGIVGPGPGIGVLTITGGYTQTAGGTLSVEAGGPGQSDRLDVAGAVGLDGTLVVGLANGYFPPVGSGFTVLTTTGGTGGSTFAGLAEGGHLDAGPTTFRATYAGGDGNDVALTAINRGPTLVTDPITILPPVPVRTKLSPDPLGMLVSDLIAGKTTDADGDPVGIAITGLDPANTITKGVPKFGAWEFTADGANWNPVPPVIPPGQALVLSADATTRVRFKPNLGFHGLSSFTFLAWDHTDDPTNTAPGTQLNLTATPTAYSTAAERAWVAVGKTRPAVTATGATRLTAVREDAKGSRVFPVKTLLGLAGRESLPATNLGVAITGLSTATGTWQYRLAKTTIFIPIDPTASPTNALLLRPTDTVRFVPALNANGTGELTFKTWVPDATFGTYATDTTGAAFGRDSGAATIPITAVNDAPVLDLTLHPDLGTVAADQTTAPIMVGALLATAPGVATDVDSTGLGILLLPASSKVGKWQYFDLASNAWKNLTLAKKLAADAQVRFQAAAGAAAGPVSLAFKVWDGKLLSKVVGTIALVVV